MFFTHFHKRDIRTLALDLSAEGRNEELRSAQEYENSDAQKEFETLVEKSEDSFEYVARIVKLHRTSLFVGTGQLDLSLRCDYKNYLDIGTGYGLMPFFISLNSSIEVFASDYNSRQVSVLQNTLKRRNLTYSVQDLFKDDLSNFSGKDVLIMGGLEFALDEITLRRINAAAAKHRIKEIWLTTNHIFEWNLKPNRSYIKNIALLALKPRVFKKGRLIGYYRSETLLLNIFKDFKIIDRKPDAFGSDVLFLRLLNQNNLS